MLAHQPGDRYQSAREILDILAKIDNNHSQNLISQMRTVILAPIQKKPKKINNSAPLEVPQINSLAPENSQSFSNISQNNTKFFPRLGPAKILGIGIAIVLLPAILSFAVVQGFLSGNSNDNNKTELTDKEQQKQKEIYQRIKNLNLNEGNFYQEVDELFYAKYPGFKKNKITNTPEHQKYRQEWYEIAEDLLDRKEKEKRI
jgi:serine/threonine-protein kinase